MQDVFLTLFNKTSNERIADMIWRTTTDGTVVDDLTLCVDTASARTRIDAFLIRTGFVESAIRAHNTFRVTSWWTSNVVSTA